MIPEPRRAFETHLYGRGGGGGRGAGGHGGGGDYSSYHGGRSTSEGDAGAAALASLQGGRTTQYIWDMGASYDAPLVPFVQYRETKGDEFLPCMMRGLNTCYRSFSGEGFRSCLYGMLVASDLVPSGAGVGYLDTDGPFAAGMSQACSTSTIDLLPKRD